MSYCMMFGSSLKSATDSAGRTPSFGRTIATFLPEGSESNIICVLLFCRCFWHPVIDKNRMMRSVVSRVFIFVTIHNRGVKLLVVPACENIVGAIGISEVCIHP